LTTKPTFKAGDICLYYLDISKITLVVELTAVCEKGYVYAKVTRSDPFVKGVGFAGREYRLKQEHLVRYQEPLDVLKEML